MSRNPEDKVVEFADYSKGFKPLDQFTLHHTLADSRGLALVMFTKSGCNACRSWKQLLLEFQKQDYRTSLFEVDVEHDPGLAHEFEIFHLPAIFLYRDGHFRGEIQCQATMVNLRQAVATTMHAPPQDGP